MSDQKKTGWNAFATTIWDAGVLIGFLTIQIVWAGFRRISWKKSDTYIAAISILFLSAVLVDHYLDLYFLYFILPRAIELRWVAPLIDVPFWVRYRVVVALASWGMIMILGFCAIMRQRRYQRSIDCVSIKNGQGNSPKVLGVVLDPPYRFKLRLYSPGIGIDRYEGKRTDLESALDAHIEQIRYLGSPKKVEITLTRGKIPDVSHYRDVAADAKAMEPSSFIVGESIGGLITRSIRTLPHLLIAGTTGGGKSIFFKQVLLSLLKTSQHIQMYVLDLKNGVEVKEFGQIPNVVVAKNESEAVIVLTKLKEEMLRRFRYMEEKSYKRIVPDRDGMDLIVIGVDEASVLYTRTKSNSKDSNLIERARELTDDLAKLARAAGIHLILATQKVTTETIDTKIQENIGGRMCFRVNTLQGSLTVLGNKMAYELPDKPGRAIWASGNDFTEVQAPMISEAEIDRECALLAYEYQTGKRKILGEMLRIAGSSKASSRLTHAGG
jgi:hypothetical protein